MVRPPFCLKSVLTLQLTFTLPPNRLRMLASFTTILESTRSVHFSVEKIAPSDLVSLSSVRTSVVLSLPRRRVRTSQRHSGSSLYSSFPRALDADLNLVRFCRPKFKACILQNHGLLTGGKTVDEAVYLFSALENQCKVQLMVEAACASGTLQKSMIDDEAAKFTAATIQYHENTYCNFQPELELLLEETDGKWVESLYFCLCVSTADRHSLSSRFLL